MVREIRFGNIPKIFDSLEDFFEEKNIESGAYEILINKIPLHFYYENRKKGTLLALFNGAVSAKVRFVPAWAGVQMAKSIDANVLLFSDPSIYLSKNLNLGWYAGNIYQQSLQENISKIISHIASTQKIILFGTSGGGYATLQQSLHIKNCLAIVSNPQTSIFKYHETAVENYLKIAWNNIEKSYIPCTTSVVKEFQSPQDCKLIYIQNTNDSFHIKNHQKPFAQSLHHSNKVIFIDRDLGSGHVGPSRESLVDIINLAISITDWNELSSQIKNLKIA